MRPLNAVINEMLMHIPEDHRLARQLKHIQGDIPYTAPEAMGIRWNQAYNELCHLVPIPKEDWEFKVISIFSTNPEEELRKAFGGKQ